MLSSLREEFEWVSRHYDYIVFEAETLLEEKADLLRFILPRLAERLSLRICSYSDRSEGGGFTRIYEFITQLFPQRTFLLAPEDFQCWNPIRHLLPQNMNLHLQLLTPSTITRGRILFIGRSRQEIEMAEHAGYATLYTPLGFDLTSWSLLLAQLRPSLSLFQYLEEQFPFAPRKKEYERYRVPIEFLKHPHVFLRLLRTLDPRDFMAIEKQGERWFNLKDLEYM